MCACVRVCAYIVCHQDNSNSFLEILSIDSLLTVGVGGADWLNGIIRVIFQTQHPDQQMTFWGQSAGGKAMCSTACPSNTNVHLCTVHVRYNLKRSKLLGCQLVFAYIWTIFVIKNEF